MTALTQPLGLSTERFFDRRHLWRAFRIANIYRLILAAVLLITFALDEQNRLFGKQHPNLFVGTVLSYMAMAVIGILGSHWRRPALKIQAHLQMLSDLLALTVMIHASGGLASSLINLLITAIAASSILLPLSSALFSAALGFFLLTGSWAITQSQGSASSALIDFQALFASSDDLVRLGVIGAALFIVAGLSHALAERARRSEALARQRTWELLEIVELNQGIVQHLQSGVVVVDGDNQVQLLNDTARELLGLPAAELLMPLGELSPPLLQRLKAWRANASYTPVFRAVEHQPELMPSFARLSGGHAANVLIMIENSEKISERLQQVKLAALGRLTAGIAHEIRNPLASIGHAAQLLLESASANAHDQRLGKIIHDNVKRANRIINDVLDLARRDRVRPERIHLEVWLENFIQEFQQGHDKALLEWRPIIEVANLEITFDPHQLQQVLWNLCANACRYGTQPDGAVFITLKMGLEPARSRPFLEIQDTGPGVASENVEKLFEPFFTTSSKGTGLGLYLARELCEANRAHLQYLPNPSGGSCFRITFAPASSATEIDLWMTTTS